MISYSQKDITFLFENDKLYHHFDDIEKIIKTLKKYRNIELTYIQANYFWMEFSDSLTSSWFPLPDNDKEIAELFDEFVNIHSNSNFNSKTLRTSLLASTRDTLPMSNKSFYEDEEDDNDFNLDFDDKE